MLPSFYSARKPARCTNKIRLIAYRAILVPPLPLRARARAPDIVLKKRPRVDAFIESSALQPDKVIKKHVIHASSDGKHDDR